MKQQISIWYFIGLLILFYGVLILGAGVTSSSRPRESAGPGGAACRNLVGALIVWRSMIGGCLSRLLLTSQILVQEALIAARWQWQNK